MTEESIVTPEKTACRHPEGWQKVKGATSPTGGMVVMCKCCSLTKNLDPPVKETGARDKRPRLLE